MVAPQSRSWTWVHSTFLTDSSEGVPFFAFPLFSHRRPYFTPVHSSGVWGRRTWLAHLPGVTLSPQTRTFFEKHNIGELPVAPNPSSVQPDVSSLCFVPPTHPGGGYFRPPPRARPPTPSLWGTGEVRDPGSSSSLSVCRLLYHLAVLLFNIAPKVFLNKTLKKKVHFLHGGRRS